MEKLSKFLRLYNSESSLESLNIEIQKISENVILEVSDSEEIIFVSNGKREIFKNQTLYDFLDNVFGKVNRRKYMGIIKADKTRSYVTIEDFLSIVKKNEATEQKTVFLDGPDSKKIMDIILKTYKDGSGNSFHFLLENLKLLSEIKQDTLNESMISSFKVLIKFLKQLSRTEKYNRYFFGERKEEFRGYLNKCIEITGYKDEADIPENSGINDITYQYKKNTVKEKTKIFNMNEAEKNEDLRYDQILDRRRADKKARGIIEMNDFYDMYELIRKTSTLLREGEFDAFIEKLKILVNINERLAKKDLIINKNLTVMLCETNRFFYIKQKEFQKYWGFFDSREDQKEEFLENIKRLKELCGLDPKEAVVMKWTGGW